MWRSTRSRLVTLLTAGVIACVSPSWETRIRKGYTDTQLDLFKDIATNIKNESKRMPTSAQVAEEMKRLDDAEFAKMDARIAKETAERTAEHGSCGTVDYERDYSHVCPAGWALQGDGSCWGDKYRGPCEARQSFKWFSNDEKLKFERRCCAFWPAREARPISTSAAMLLTALHGSVDPDDGRIVAPRA